MGSQPANPPQPFPPQEHTPGWMTREPAIVLVLVLNAAAFFGLTHFYTRAFQLRRDQLAARWFDRGEHELESGKASSAVDDLRTALSYAPDDAGYRLRLAQALAQAGRTNEARAYFGALWEAQPGNGLLNLELARLAVRRNDVASAMRFFHGAIYGVWSDDPRDRRRQARLDLIHFLLDRHQTAEADAEIIGLAADSPDNAASHMESAALFEGAQDYERALSQYVAALNLNPVDPVALAGAGHAAFKLGRYRTAAGYLGDSLKKNPQDSQSRSEFDLAELVLDLDPYAPMSGPARRRRVIQNFQTAGARLESCAAAQHQDLNVTPPSTPLQVAHSQWTQLKPRISDNHLRRDPDLVDTAMNLVFTIENQALSTCGAPTGADLALTLLASAGRYAER